MLSVGDFSEVSMLSYIAKVELKHFFWRLHAATRDLLGHVTSLMFSSVHVRLDGGVEAIFFSTS